MKINIFVKISYYSYAIMTIKVSFSYVCNINVGHSDDNCVSDSSHRRTHLNGPNITNCNFLRNLVV
jgi:hypothetical protein